MEFESEKALVELHAEMARVTGSVNPVQEMRDTMFRLRAEGKNTSTLVTTVGRAEEMLEHVIGCKIRIQLPGEAT